MSNTKSTSKFKNVTIRRAKSLDMAYLKAISSTLQEWSSQNDEEDYRKLGAKRNSRRLIR